MKKIPDLFLTFFKIGAFTFGGGYAMIPLIQRETVERKEWISSDDLLEITAVAESTPGPMAINAATFIGYRVGGFFGALAATLGVVIPSFAIVLLITFLLSEFSSIRAVGYAFFGIRAAVCALILKALAGMFKKCDKTAIAYMIMLLAFVCTAILSINVLAVILGCALIGLAFFMISLRRSKKK